MSAWEPIFDGAAAERAWAVVRGMAQALRGGTGLGGGAGDRAVFWAYFAGALDDEPSQACLEDATLALCASLTAHDHLGLHGGLAGNAWALAHISEADVASDLLDAVDRTLLDALAVERWTREVDLIGGLAGYVVYALERFESSCAPQSEAVLRRCVDHLVATCERIGEGAAWHTEPALLPACQRARWPEGCFHCGAAHGVPGIAGVLGRITAALDEPRARPLCEAALCWLADQQRPGDPRGRFPDACTRSGPTVRSVDAASPRPARTAWCDGDSGIAVAAWSAVARLGGSSGGASAVAPWRELALEIAARPAELCGIQDAALCHGAAGLGHLFNRCYQATREPRFRDAARAWLERALALPLPGGAELIDGPIGVGLALLAAVEPMEPRWDRVLLCDLPIA